MGSRLVTRGGGESSDFASPHRHTVIAPCPSLGGGSENV
jgi:hypothetical protein